MNGADIELSCFRKAFTPKNFRDILFVHEYIGKETIVDIPAMRDDANRAAAQQLLQPLLGGRTVEFSQVGRIDPAKSDPLASNTNRIAIDRAYS